MKVMFFIVLFALSGCYSSKKDHHVVVAEKPYSLQNSDFPVELIEAFVPFVGPSFKANNQHHLSYELTILNNRRIPFNLKSIEISSFKDPSAVLATFDSEYLAEHFTRHGLSKEDDPMELKGGQFGVANIWLTISDDVALPAQIFHKLVFERVRAEGENSVHRMEVASIEIPEPTDMTLGLPFKHGTWIYGANSHRNSRAITAGSSSYPQRYAIDWLMLEEDGGIVSGDLGNNSNWVTYGVDLLAVADGTIVEVNDGLIENTPGADKMAVRITRDTIGGNYLVLDIGNNVHAYYAHLIPGSLTVKVGDVVAKGQVLGSLGNSGSSDAPHLHFHLETKSLRALGGQGLPYHFAAFNQVKTYNDNEFGALFGLEKIPFEPSSSVSKVLEMPMGNGIIKFE